MEGVYLAIPQRVINGFILCIYNFGGLLLRENFKLPRA